MNYDEAKAEVMSVNTAVLLAGRVHQLADREHAAAGFVTWDAGPPVHVPYVLHKLSFLDAVYTSLEFVARANDTICRREWLVVSHQARVVLRSLDRFKEVEPEFCPPTPLWHVGYLGTIIVYMNPALPPDEWMAGGIMGAEDDSKLSARGLVINSPTAFGDVIQREPVPMPGRVPAGAAMWRALQGVVDDQMPEDQPPPLDPNEEAGDFAVNPTDVIEEPPEFQRLNEGRILL